jgi:uncharacterized protein (DUF697 family)
LARLHPFAVLGLLREVRAAAVDPGPLVVAGAPALADVLRRELTREDGASAVRAGPVEGAASLVYVLAAEPAEEDERVLRLAHRERVPIVCVLAGPQVPDRIPYVLATDVVRVPAGSGFPVREIARAVARRLGEEGTSLAAALPLLRRPLAEELTERFARRAALIGVAVFVPGTDMPAITLLQLRLALRIGAAHGVEIDNERLPEILAVIGSGFAFRAVARQALGVVPVAGWAIKGAVAYAGTRAVGEAATRYFETRTGSAVRSGS